MMGLTQSKMNKILFFTFESSFFSFYVIIKENSLGDIYENTTNTMSSGL